MKKLTAFALLATILLLSAPVSAQENLISLSLEDAPLDQAIELYSEWTGRTVLRQKGLDARITLRGRQLTIDEAKQAVQTILAMHGVGLVPMGERFLKVVPIDQARQEGMEILPFDPDRTLTDADILMTQVIPLRHVMFQDVQPLIQHLVHGYGKIQHLERINSVLVTDTSLNIARILELIAMVDQPAEKIEPRIYQLQHAEASGVAGKLRELVEAARTRTSEQTVVSARADERVPGVVRAPRSETVTTETLEPTEMIQGEVKFVADERTNILIIFSKEANFAFFDRIIDVLDVPVDPAVVVEVINLEHANAGDISSILNEFVGAAQATEQRRTRETDADTERTTTAPARDTLRAPARPAASETLSPADQRAIGRLSADTRILSDERTNSLLLMGRRSDIEALKQVIKTLDVMLEQVMIEVVILSVSLGDELSTGVQWVYDTQTGRDDDGNLLPTRELIGWDAGGLGTTNSTIARLGSGLSYYGTFPRINMQALIKATQKDSTTRILSTPVVLTTDNTEAKITVGEERPVVTSSVSREFSSGARSTYQYRTIGMTLTVTPNINPQGFVVMEVSQTADDIIDTTTIDGNEVPVVSKREVNATVAVQDRSTVVLGGLVRTEEGLTRTKIPLLGDIPLLGRLFSTRSDKEDRRELVILLTPYVLSNPAQAQQEARRILEASDARHTEWPAGWSESPLRNEPVVILPVEEEAETEE